MKKSTIIIVILSLIILVGGLVFAYNNIKDRAYQQGIQDATLLINQQIINSLQQEGYVPYYVPINETALVRIKLIPET